ncbi:hypothetical protein [Paenibacillus sp. NPDC057934]|uniref:hypothetical protein n=1 Tax=Paenibacillus sp. NPDC057934 TaxID=3346282 RepID=UPI0036DDA2E3
MDSSFTKAITEMRVAAHGDSRRYFPADSWTDVRWLLICQGAATLCCGSDIINEWIVFSGAWIPLYHLI